MTRIAIWTPGGVGGGNFNQGYPKLMEILRDLSSRFELVVFTSVKVDQSVIPSLQIVSPPAGLRSSIRKWLYLVRRYISLNRYRAFDLMLSFWAYPSGMMSVLLGRYYHKPSIVIVLGGDVAFAPEADYGLLMRPFYRRLVLWTCLHATELIAVSTYQVNTLKRFGLRRTPLVIPWGVDRDQFRRENKFVAKPIHFLHVGNLTEVKNQLMLLEAFEKLSRQVDCVLRIVGPDYMEGRMQKRTLELGLGERIEFTGAVPYAETSNHYAWADVYLLTSFSEGQNLTLTEAGMAGLLLVSTPVGAAVDIGEEGVLQIPFNEPVVAATRIMELLGNRDQRQRMMEHSVSWAEAHDFQWTMNQLTNVINRIHS